MTRDLEIKCNHKLGFTVLAREGMTPKESERVKTGTISIKSSSHSRRRMRKHVGNARKIELK